MKRLLVVGLCCAVHHAHGFFEHHARTLELMDQLFAELHERTRFTKLDAPDYNVQMQRKGDGVEISLAVPATVTAQDISVQTEDGSLYVVIAAQRDRVELKLSENVLGISVSTQNNREEQDERGNMRVVASGSSHMAQMVTLPAIVDIERKAPAADLANGVLTLTLAVKGGATKIPVTTSGAQPIMPVPMQLDSVQNEIGRDVFKDTFTK